MFDPYLVLIQKKSVARIEPRVNMKKNALKSRLRLLLLSTAKKPLKFHLPFKCSDLTLAFKPYTQPVFNVKIN